MKEFSALLEWTEPDLSPTLLADAEVVDIAYEVRPSPIGAIPPVNPPPAQPLLRHGDGDLEGLLAPDSAISCDVDGAPIDGPRLATSSTKSVIAVRAVCWSGRDGYREESCGDNDACAPYVSSPAIRAGPHTIA